jgi:hypothetical protein
MAFARPLLLAAAVVGCLAVAPTAHSESLAGCAQSVIRDWYSGGRVDGVYPLRCYSAAIRALPEDVLQYSDADRDIARALAYARRGRAEPAARPQAAPTTAVVDREPVTKPTRTVQRVSADRRPARGAKEPARLASGPATETVSGALPYPVIVLGAVAGVLLLSGAAGWLAARRR